MENSNYMLVKALKIRESVFVKVGDEPTLERFRNKCNNTNMVMSVCLYTKPNFATERLYQLYFRVAGNDAKDRRTCALEACYYITEYFHVPEHYIGIIYIAGADDTVDADNKINYDGDENVNDNYDKGTSLISTYYHNRRAVADILILISPIVFGGWPTPLMPAINYELARQMVKDGVKVDFDVYWRDYCIPLPNSIHNGRYITPMTVNEILNLDVSGIDELTKNPRPEISMTIPYRVPEAVEWFAEIYRQAEKQRKHQQQLLEIMLRDGWQTPKCIRYLLLKELGDNAGLEACRITAQFYAAIGACETEIWHYIMKWAQRHAYKNYHKLKAIVTFAMENPCICYCDHPLLRRFCLPGKCFMAELMDKLQNPYLFELYGA